MSSKADSIDIIRQPGKQGVPASLERLSKITVSLKRLSGIIFSLTVLNTAAFWFVFLPTLYYPALEDMRNYLMRNGFFILPIVAAAISVFRYEQQHREGDALFDEISDELEWDVKGRSGKIADERPNLDVRLILRSFAKAEDLLFVPGRFGPALYLLFNFLSSVLAFWVSRR